MLKILLAAATLSIVATPALAAPCKDAKGRFMKCPPAKPTATKCRLNGKFAKCSTPGAKPA
ncbi:hypothetical protein U1872_02580 [Sphingomonas sp. RB3P16]|uniref:hypothetical protein n=1 Tax=Parasphingomonas frigoris TaxID=3096163 RepID=UPI002FC963E8